MGADKYGIEWSGATPSGDIVVLDGGARYEPTLHGDVDISPKTLAASFALSYDHGGQVGGRTLRRMTPSDRGLQDVSIKIHGAWTYWVWDDEEVA